MEDMVRGSDRNPATAARVYDYLLGGIHNFPADQDVARTLIAQFPEVAVGARANRAFLRRAVRYLTDAGIRQFLDVGSGIPTEGNVHEIAQRFAPDSRVVYVDIDPVAVSESLEILAGNDRATAIRADLHKPQSVLDSQDLRSLLNLEQPTALLLGAVLHFVPDDAVAHGLVTHLVDALAPGSFLVVTHAAVETFLARDSSRSQIADLYQRQTATPSRLRTRSETARFFTGRVELVDPGVVWLSEWRPDLDEPDDAGHHVDSARPANSADPTEPADLANLANDPSRSCAWAGVGRIG